ncbi:MAG TPA: hypothetical protein VM051_00205 [Usitatibacter sp.]|nr:hypothetical protein [Usitatibacter sp.]
MLKRILLALILAAALVPAQASHSVRELYLEEIIDDAAIVFQGTVTENRSARDPEANRIVTYTTFVVQDVLKGDVGSTHTIKQLGGHLAGEGIGYKAHVRTTFDVGQTYVVFLYGKSSVGFSSPVGSTQGSFTVVQDEAGAAVSNGRDFAKMTEHMAADQERSNSLPKARGDGKKVGLDEFKRLVRGHAGVAK